MEGCEPAARQGCGCTKGDGVPARRWPREGWGPWSEPGWGLAETPGAGGDWREGRGGEQRMGWGGSCRKAREEGVSGGDPGVAEGQAQTDRWRERLDKQLESRREKDKGRERGVHTCGGCLLREVGAD